MSSILIAPGAPLFGLALASALVALLGLALQQGRAARPGGPPIALAAPARLAIGQAAGVALAAPLLLAALAGGGPQARLLLAAALAAYLWLGLSLPRLPEQRRRREAAALRRLTPGLSGFIRVGLGSFESPAEILRRYVARPRPQLAPMQQLVAEALRLGQDERLRPFAALARAARARSAAKGGCRELSDLAELLAQAEAEGGRVEAVLAAQQASLELVLQSEFKRLIGRRTIYLLLMVAVSLVVGILINLLYVMTAGGAVFGRL